MNCRGEKIGVFTRDVKHPLGITYSHTQRLLFVCEPKDRKILQFSTSTNEKMRSVRNDGFSYPWFVCASATGYGIYVSDYMAMSVFHVRNENDVEEYKERNGEQSILGQCVCFQGKCFVCAQEIRKIKVLQKGGFCDKKECSFKPFLILRNGGDNNTLIIVSTNGHIESLRV